MEGVKVRVRPEIEELIKKVSRKHGYTTDTIRNLSILVGLGVLNQILKSQPTKLFLKNLYITLLKDLGGDYESCE